MAGLYELSGPADVESPVLVMAMDGWIDAGLGAATAAATVLSTVATEPVAIFDNDTLVDQRARRPVMHIVDGVNTGLTWPSIELRAGVDHAGEHLLLLVGPEPDMHWRAFAQSIVELALHFGVRIAVDLGAFPAPVPHTRSVRLASTASSADLAAKVGFMGGAIDVPAGIHGALEVALSAAGVPTVGIWARVPHYVAAMPYPAASAALLDGLSSLTGLHLESGDLHAAAAATRERIDDLIANSGEHRMMVEQLESEVDAAEGPAPAVDFSNLPSGDEIAAELQRFLRGER